MNKKLYSAEINKRIMVYYRPGARTGWITIENWYQPS